MDTITTTQVIAPQCLLLQHIAQVMVQVMETTVPTIVPDTTTPQVRVLRVDQAT